MSQFATDTNVQGCTNGTEGITTKITETVAEAEGIDPIDLPPLYSVVDPDALEALFQPRTELGDPTARVVFTYNGYEVTVDADGTVDIE